VRVGEAGGERVAVEVQAREIARVGVVAQAEVYPVGAIVDGRSQGGQAARRTDQIQVKSFSRQSIDFRSPSSTAAPPQLTAVNGTRGARQRVKKCLLMSYGARISRTKILTWNNF
jgi:hypothetical protein